MQSFVFEIKLKFEGRKLLNWMLSSTGKPVLQMRRRTDFIHFSVNFFKQNFNKFRFNVIKNIGHDKNPSAFKTNWRMQLKCLHAVKILISTDYSQTIIKIIKFSCKNGLLVQVRILKSAHYPYIDQITRLRDFIKDVSWVIYPQISDYISNLVDPN